MDSNALGLRDNVFLRLKEELTAAGDLLICRQVYLQ